MGSAYTALSPDLDIDLAGISVAAVVQIRHPMMPRCASAFAAAAAVALILFEPKETGRNCFDRDGQLGTDDIDQPDKLEVDPEQSEARPLSASAAMGFAEAPEL